MQQIIASMDPFVIAWLVLVVIFLIVELMTVGLTSIWFAIGALIALLVAILGGPVPLQIVLFIIVSIGLLVATKPWVTKFINSKTQKTNADRVIGTHIRIAETVNNIEQTGMAVVNGQEWTVRTKDDEEIIEAGELAEVLGISGIKLIVKKAAQGAKKEEENE